MAIYRETRNLEYSLNTYLTNQLRNDGWNGVTVVKGFAKAYNVKTLPIIAISMPDDSHDSKELGSTAVTTFYKVVFHIFANEDGIKLDLKDWLIEVITKSIPYYEVATEANGEVSVRSEVSRIAIKNILSNRDINLGDAAAQHDRHRRQIEILMYITGRA